MRRIFNLLLLGLACTAMSFAGVTTSAPTSGATVTSPVQFTASATSPDAGIASMTINVDSQNVYSVYAASVNTSVALAAGKHTVIMKAWDDKGNYFDQQFSITVSGTSTASSSPVSSTSGGVNTSSPSSGASVGSPVQFIASASSPSAAISAMTINIDSQNVYTVDAASLNTSVALGAGSHSVVMKAWDAKGNYFDQTFNITVTSGSLPAPASGQTVITNVQQMPGWTGCSECAAPGGTGATASYSMVQNVSSPSLDGAATQFWLGGSTPYTNALFTNHLAGSETASNFILDFYFWIGDASYAQGLEFDIFYARDGLKNYFLTECDSAGMYAGTWKFNDEATDTWVPSGLPCKVTSNAWNHVTLEFQRLSDGNTHIVSASMNGNVQYPNMTFNAIAVSDYELTPAIQLDGDASQNNFSIYVDKMNVTYW